MVCHFYVMSCFHTFANQLDMDYFMHPESKIANVFMIRMFLVEL